jgi:hypothetical protein
MDASSIYVALESGIFRIVRWGGSVVEFATSLEPIRRAVPFFAHCATNWLGRSVTVEARTWPVLAGLRRARSPRRSVNGVTRPSEGWKRVRGPIRRTWRRRVALDHLRGDEARVLEIHRASRGATLVMSFTLE